ncbi:hypothetical protein HHI36_008355, partial [Cryptolaemus montrouzieri]
LQISVRSDQQMQASHQTLVLEVLVPDVVENTPSYESDDPEEVPLSVLKTKSSAKQANEEIKSFGLEN